MDSQSDVLILGGGLAGFTCALQLIRRRPETKITVIERNTFPLAESVGKVGESSVEIAAEYFLSVLGLREHFEKDQLPKLGLRYFLETTAESRTDSVSQSGKKFTPLDHRLEVGNNRFAPTPSFQLDRARLENYLYQELLARGVKVQTGRQVREVVLSDPSSGLHQVRTAGSEERLSGRWVVDASGRASLLRKSLGLQQKIAHQGTSVWWRMNGEWRIDDWCDDPAWKSLHQGDVARWFSTNHFMGRGYWVWVIPLASGATSFGIVADERIHSFRDLHTYDKALHWLDIHEPLVSAKLRENPDALLDFTGMKNYVHGCQEVFSPQRWALTGEAGLFIDPFYSPGSDFIAIGNTYICDLIARDLAGEQISLRATIYNDLYLRFAHSTTATYEDQYAILGNPLVLPLKVFWDWCFYWHFLARLFFERKTTDLRFVSKARADFEGFEQLGEGMQKLFRKWDLLERPEANGGFLNLAKHPYLFELNRSLLESDRSTPFEVQFAHDLSSMQQLATEICACFTRRTGEDVDERLATALNSRTVSADFSLEEQKFTPLPLKRPSIIGSFIEELESFLVEAPKPIAVEVRQGEEQAVTNAL